MELPSVNNTLLPTNQIPVDNTTTFIIGFGVLLLFVVVGVLASAFLCITLKKDAYLWEAEREGRMQEQESGRCDSQRDRDKEENNTTQI